MPKPHSKPPQQPPKPAPDDRRIVVMGRVIAPFGVKGWLKLRPLSDSPENLVASRIWWARDPHGASWREVRIEDAKLQGETVVAKFEGCDDRDAAVNYRGVEVAVLRESLPKAAANEFYWADLIGLAVVNEQGETFGRVSRLFETGANDVLVVEGANAGERERLIPFIEDVVKEVDIAGGVIRVAWSADY